MKRGHDEKNSVARSELLPVWRLKGVGPAISHRFQAAGVITVQDLTNHCQSQDDLNELATKTGLSARAITAWVAEGLALTAPIPRTRKCRPDSFEVVCCPYGTLDYLEHLKMAALYFDKVHVLAPISLINEFDEVIVVSVAARKGATFAALCSGWHDGMKRRWRLGVW